ncbi:alpha/beta hydrolase family protein [Bergeyella zoohelcum]|uniref:Alpha/beta hydrolase family n=1 Tax=Bergeyella zoohelcum TaxID=1015 RepID=A0A380ZSP4_9FLAO|nr:prolyl oligopeptidase family serine peptidase [Bergeyella zoohelcum]EKB61690.1 hypothetical protein HMPREF9700_00052 [Bergeyella zoohelcum CCUG 30536]SUV52353.1 Alpha/beta hydrolase family [Bergeyella zoohelcum]
MKKIFVFLLFFVFVLIMAQEVRRDSVVWNGAVSHYLILSKEGEQFKRKPLFFFCQGSLARPLQILVSKEMGYPILPFELATITRDYHLVIVNKPALPLSEYVQNLKEDLTYPKVGLPPKQYIVNNHLDFYYKRNNHIIKKLVKQSWVDAKKIVVAGHSEGAYIALQMAKHNSKISHLIYSGGNPLGRMMSIIHMSRQAPDEEEDWVQDDLKDWKKIVENRKALETHQENTSFYSYSLSQNFIPDLLQLKIPILVTYGTKDQNGIFNDYLQVVAIQENKNNFTFKSYFNCEHNFFPIENGKPNHSKNNWDQVAQYWVQWIASKSNRH